MLFWELTAELATNWADEVGRSRLSRESLNDSDATAKTAMIA